MRLEGKAQKRVPDRSGGVDRRGDTAEGIGAVEQYRGRTGGVNKGMGRAGSSKEKRRADREGGKGEGRVRRGYTPEPVYGQKCGSPRLANRSGQGIV